MESAKSALASTKRTHAAIKKHEDDGTSPDSQELREWRTVVAAANKELSRMVKKLANQEERHKVEMAMINDEVRGELVDREANNARVAERFRMQLERESSSLSFDRVRTVDSNQTKLHKTHSMITTQPTHSNSGPVHF